MSPLLGWALLALVCGLGVLVLEVFLPTSGTLAILSITLLTVAVVLGFQAGVVAGASILGAVMVGVPSMVVIGFWILPHTPIGRMMINRTSIETVTNDVAWSELRSLVGQVGKALSPMLPAGAIEINGKSYDAIARGMSVDAGQFVKVIEARANRVVVIPVEIADAAEEEVAASAPAPQAPHPRALTAEEAYLSKPLAELGIDSFDGPMGK